MSNLGVLQLRSACRVGCRFLEELEHALRCLVREDLSDTEVRAATDIYAEAKAYLRVLLGSERDLSEVERNVMARILARGTR